MTPSNPDFSPILCHKCPGNATRVAIEPSGGHRYRCRSCKRTFVHGGPGMGKLPAPVAMEAARLMMDNGLSIMEASRQMGIAKSTGRAIFRRVARLRSAELVRLLSSPVEARAEVERMMRDSHRNPVTEVKARACS